jgi:hypothetical protein
MPPFGARKAAPAESKPAEPAPPALTTTERLNALLIEQGELRAVVADRQAERARLLREAEAPSLGAVTALAAETDQAKLQLEWIAGQLPGLYAQLEAERAAAYEAAWQSHRPHLRAAEDRLRDAITEFHSALLHAHEAFAAARGFGERVTDEFVRPPPLPPVYNDWSLQQYLAAIGRRQQAAPSMQVIELSVEAWPDVPAVQRFVPRRVPYAEIEAISPIAAPRRVRILHGPIRTANLQCGIARMFAGEEHTVPARAAHALAGSGCAEYLDEAAASAA